MPKKAEYELYILPPGMKQKLLNYLQTIENYKRQIFSHEGDGNPW